jgi:cell wall-associated NlpC family hydrolase
MIPGAGMDCIGVNAWCYLKTGFLETSRRRRIASRKGSTPRNRRSSNGSNSGRFAKVDEAQFGDTLCFQFRQRVIFHVGLKVQADKFVHVLERRCVEFASLNDRTYAASLRAIYRPLRREAAR